MQWQLPQSSNKVLRVKIWSKSPIFRVLSAFLLVCVSTASLHFLRIPGNSAPDFPCATASAEKVIITIGAGESGSSIAQALFTSGITKSAEAFFRVAVGDVRSQKIAPGNHTIDKHLCATKALDQLLDSSRIAGLINITEGAWLSEVLPQFYSANFSKADIATALKSVIKPKGFTALEGLLFPAQYSFAEGTSATVALQSMVDRASEEMKNAGFSSDKKFSPQQLLIIASLIQAEGNTQDFSKISQVIRNRIAKGMPLQFDSTVHYIKKSRGSVFLSTQSTLINSAYNTYRRYGLPPGPINNPGADALRAAVNPISGDWLYFITVAPFDTRFTSDLNEFNTWKIEYKKNLRDGKFRSKK
ncbi:MAG: hypothetical protein RL470_332 [Actinomycetota bacterium]